MYHQGGILEETIRIRRGLDKCIFQGCRKLRLRVGKNIVNTKQMLLQEFINKSCAALENKELSGRDNQLVDYNEAFYRVNTIYNANVVGAQEISIDKLRNFLDQIDTYNQQNDLNGTDAEVISLRLWKAVSHFDTQYKNVDDVVICPVRKDGDDAHAHAERLPIDPNNAGAGDLQMLSSGRPCPNLCGTRKYFFLEDSNNDGFPPQSGNRYRNVKFADVTKESFVANFDEDTLIR